MDDLYYHLEAQIKALIQQCEQLKQANLKQKQIKALLIREKDMLLAKHNVAIAQIENMLHRLKSIEKPQ